MARKKKHPEHVNHERWLISYADFITLLFAFFVVMFAVSQVDSKKVGRFTESFSKAVGVDMFPQPGHGLLSGATDGTVSDNEGKGSMLPEELASLRVSLAQNASTTASPLSGVEVISKRNELVLRLADNLLFESGNNKLEERARQVIALLAADLRNRKLDIRVEGHTDDRPIHTARYASNWELSTARATTIVVRLAAEGIAPTRLSAAGYGEFHPVATNATEEGRKKNRRVDLVVTLPLPPEPVDATEESPPAPPSTNRQSDGESSPDASSPRHDDAGTSDASTSDAAPAKEDNRHDGDGHHASDAKPNEDAHGSKAAEKKPSPHDSHANSPHSKDHHT